MTEEDIYYKDKIEKIKKRFNVDIPPHSTLDGNIILYNLCKDPTLIFLISKFITKTTELSIDTTIPEPKNYIKNTEKNVNNDNPYDTDTHIVTKIYTEIDENNKLDEKKAFGELVIKDIKNTYKFNKIHTQNKKNYRIL